MTSEPRSADLNINMILTTVFFDMNRIQIIWLVTTCCQLIVLQQPHQSFAIAAETEDGHWAVCDRREEHT